MDETFLLSNIAPQIGSGFNRHCPSAQTPFPMAVRCAYYSSNHVDWAYLESWCRQLTSSFSDVYVFTIPLYLPHKESDGKWRVVRLARTTRLLKLTVLFRRRTK
jgi:endonuclease G